MPRLPAARHEQGANYMTLPVAEAGCCTGHPCDYCETCRKGTCCGEHILTADRDIQVHEDALYAPLGDLIDTPDGVVCHLCGWVGDRLYVHARQEHALTASEYRTKFSLNRRTPLASQAWRDRKKEETDKRSSQRGNDALEDWNRNATSEQRSLLTWDRHRRIEYRENHPWFQSNAQRELAQRHVQRLKDDRVYARDWRTSLRKAGHDFNPGQVCPECGALFCTWTSRESGQSTKRKLCGSDECLKAARSRAARKANKVRWTDG